MTRETSSTGSSSYPMPGRVVPCAAPLPIRVPLIAVRPVPGGPYTLGNSGTVAEVGLDVPFVPVPVTDVSGDSGRERPDRGASLMRVSENVKSRDCARFVSDRGFVSWWSFNFDSRRESEPRLRASSAVWWCRCWTLGPCKAVRHHLKHHSAHTYNWHGRPVVGVGSARHVIGLRFEVIFFLQVVEV